MSITNNHNRSTSGVPKKRTPHETLQDRARLALWVLTKSMLDPGASESSRIAGARAILKAKVRLSAAKEDRSLVEQDLGQTLIARINEARAQVRAQAIADGVFRPELGGSNAPCPIEAPGNRSAEIAHQGICAPGIADFNDSERLFSSPLMSDRRQHILIDG